MIVYTTEKPFKYKNWHKRTHAILFIKVKQSVENHQLTKTETSRQRQFDVTIEGRPQ